nr:hypothetical protein [Tanacetum cinerariifolium]
MVIKKLKEKIKSLSGNMKEDKNKKEQEDSETINIELDHRVTKLIAKNEHSKQTYKKLHDSIKSSCIHSKEQYDDLINQVNLKSAENSDLNASLQEKVLVITTLKDNLRKLKGKVVVDDAITSHPIDPEMLKVDVVKENSKKDKIGSKTDKNGKRGEAGKSVEYNYMVFHHVHGVHASGVEMICEMDFVRYPQFPPQYESEPGYNENDTSYPYDSSSLPQQYLCCAHCG